MNFIIPVLQIILALGLLNVWLLRATKKTGYRGGAASSLKEEFSVYGLPDWVFQCVRFLKITSAILFLVGLWFPVVVAPAATVICLLMIGAIVMHIKVKDPLIKSLPAVLMLIMSALVLQGQI